MLSKYASFFPCLQNAVYLAYYAADCKVLEVENLALYISADG